MKLSHASAPLMLLTTLALTACNPPKLKNREGSALDGAPVSSPNSGSVQKKPIDPPLPNSNPIPASGDGTGQGDKTAHDVIVQLFNFPFRSITAEVPTLAKIGYGAIHVSPPNLTIHTDQWWGRYQPVDYRVIAGPLGNEAEFRDMITVAHANGIKIFVDIVFNHTANPTSQFPKEAGEIVAAKGPLFTPADYHPAACIKDYSNIDEVRNLRMCGGGTDAGLPDLDQNSPHVLEVQQDFLKRLNAMGVDGYRLDAVKHMEPDYFKKLLTPEIRNGKYVYGEIIADQSAYDRDLAPYLAADPMSFYDFPLRATVQKAFALGGSLATLVAPNLVSSKAAMPADKSITFVMNHDLPNNDAFKSMILDPVDEQLGYAFLLGRSQGVPYVFSDLGIKGGAGLKSDRWLNAHRGSDIAKMIAFHNTVRGQGESVVAADSCLLVLQRGTKGLVAINKCGETKKVSIDGKFAAGIQLTNISNGEKVSGSELHIPSRSYLMLTAP